MCNAECAKRGASIVDLYSYNLLALLRRMIDSSRRTPTDGQPTRYAPLRHVQHKAFSYTLELSSSHAAQGWNTWSGLALLGREGDFQAMHMSSLEAFSERQDLGGRDTVVATYHRSES